MGDRNRLRIVFSLMENGELCVCQIHEWLKVSAPTASNHLNILKDTGLVLSRKDGKWVHYSLNKQDVSLLPFLKWLNDKLYDDSGLKVDIERLKKITSCSPIILRRKQRKKLFASK